ncbi:unnamed protein product [Leptidea sinapis]|uniref:Uncharacterized protein n=1 Tax=Leptidea sinapis TaxID=189913 RepID=A0A5E4PVV1_9NEOP|nr:unnamed protein product [Leptidea sinapis]
MATLKEEDDYQYSPCKAFRQLLQELNDFAGQREVVAENLQSNVQHLNEGAKQMAVLNTAIGALERARRAYERAARDSERALEAFQKADADFNLREAKNKYEIEESSVRGSETGDLDEKRIKNIKNFMLSSVDVERKVFPIIMKLIERYKSGFLPPEDFRFEAATGADATDSAPTHQTHNHLTAARGTVSGNRIKKRGGLLSIFSSNKVLMYYFYLCPLWSSHNPGIRPNHVGFSAADDWIMRIIQTCRPIRRKRNYRQKWLRSKPRWRDS